MSMHMIYLTEAATILDSLTLTVVVVGVLVILLSLLIIFWFFRSVFNTLVRLISARPTRSKRNAAEQAQITEDIRSGEVSAAIAMALYQHFSELHDRESGVVTIKRVSKPYSPWSSKLYNMRNPKIR